MSSSAPIVDRIRIIPRTDDFLDRNFGNSGEVFFDRDSNSLRLYDGDFQGGYTVLTNQNLQNNLIDSGVAIVEYTVTVGTDPDGIEAGNKYFINGEYKPQLNFVIGYTYIFNQNDQTNEYFPNPEGGDANIHPLNFSADNLNGLLGGGTLYSLGVVYKLDGDAVDRQTYYDRFTRSAQRSVQITVTSATASTLYYWCSQHTNMGNSITTASPGTGSGSGGGASVSVSDTAPASPTNGAIWFNIDTGKLYIYVEDEDSNQWVQPAYPVPATLTDLGISDGTVGQVLTTDGAGGFTFEDASGAASWNDLLDKPTTIAGFGITDAVVDFADLGVTPTTLAGYGITDAQALLVSGTNIKTINGTNILGSGNITISGSGSTGSIEFSGTTIDSADSSGIVFTPAVTMSSDLTVENGLFVNNDLVISGAIQSEGSGIPEVFSDNEIYLTAGTRVIVTQSPIKMASFTTTERDLLSAQNGDVIYNTTDNKFQGYENGAWANLI